MNPYFSVGEKADFSNVAVRDAKTASSPFEPSTVVPLGPGLSTTRCELKWEKEAPSAGRRRPSPPPSATLAVMWLVTTAAKPCRWARENSLEQTEAS